jgi:2-polyprenyl-6-methoxyphenol hydroxylase-like FAD-dependent oxidoreductase
MFGREKPQVLVAGAGPVGLVTALTLAKRGIRVRVIDEGWRTAAHSYALALHPSSLRLLDDLGIVDDVLSRSYLVRKIGLYEGEERRAEIDYGDLAGQHNYLAVVPQSKLEEVLESALETAGASVKWNHRLSQLEQQADHVAVTIDRMTMESLGYAVAHTEWVVASTHEYEMPFVVGTDGHTSMVRRSLDIEFENAGRTRYFAVFEFKTDFDSREEMRLVLGERTTNVLWPLPGGFCRWSFELTDFTAPPATRAKDRFLIQREELPELTDDNLRHMLSVRAPWFTGSVGEVEWRTVVRFEQRLATRFGGDRVWLAGDAAHMALPVAVQSMNVGFSEAHRLGTAMADVLAHDGKLDELSRYGIDRLDEWRLLLGLEGSVAPTPDAPPWVRKHARRLISSIPASDVDLKRLLERVGLSIIIPEHRVHA